MKLPCFNSSVNGLKGILKGIRQVLGDSRTNQTKPNQKQLCPRYFCSRHRLKTQLLWGEKSFQFHSGLVIIQCCLHTFSWGVLNSPVSVSVNKGDLLLLAYIGSTGLFNVMEPVHHGHNLWWLYNQLVMWLAWFYNLFPGGGLAATAVVK